LKDEKPHLDLSRKPSLVNQPVALF